MGSWHELEEAVKELRRDYRQEFDQARDFMYGIDALVLMKKIQSVLPHTTIQVIDDFEQAGGKGSSPAIILRGPECIETPTHPLILGQGFTSAKTRKHLRVFSRLDEETVTVSVWRSSTWVHKDGSEKPGIGSSLYHRLAYGKNDLSVELLLGAREFTRVDDDLNERLVDALGLKNPLPPLKPLKRK